VHGPASSSRRARVAAGALALAAVVALSCFLDLGRPALWDPGESRYAETVREMMLTGDWIAPTLNFGRYYDKPPAFFWLVRGSFAAFGTSEWAARLPSAVAAVLTIAIVVRFAWRRLGARAALGAGAVLATAIQFVVLARSVRMDMLLTFLLTATLVQAYALWEQRGADDGPSARASWPVDSASWPLYVFTVVGILVKGPVALILPVGIVAAFLVATRTPPGLARLRPGPASLIALGLLALWYLTQGIFAPDYLWTFLWQHNFGRFVGRALAGHHEPIWFYLWILPVTFLPWTLFLVGALRHGWRRARRGDRLAVFLLAWIIVPFVFFSASRAKLATYLLPIFPALALLVGTYLDRVLRAPAATRARAFAIPALVWTAGMAAIAIGPPIGIAIAYPGYGRAALPASMLALFPLLGWRAIRGAAWRAVPVLVLAAALATQVLFYRVGAPVVDDFSSLRDAALIAADLPPTAPIFAYKTRGHSFTYYGGRSLLRVRSPADAAAALGRSGPTAVLVKRRHLEKIRAHLTAPACIWWQSPSGRVLIANLPHPAQPGVPFLPASATTTAPFPHC
jgi:4-amino-4-deoxy-L-arabinose transferase-like glycosyltransferase